MDTVLITNPKAKIILEPMVEQVLIVTITMILMVTTTTMVRTGIKATEQLLMPLTPSLHLWSHSRLIHTVTMIHINSNTQFQTIINHLVLPKQQSRSRKILARKRIIIRSMIVVAVMKIRKTKRKANKVSRVIMVNKIFQRIRNLKLTILKIVNMPFITARTSTHPSTSKMPHPPTPTHCTKTNLHKTQLIISNNNSRS